MNRFLVIPLSVILLAGWVDSQPSSGHYGPRCRHRPERQEPLMELRAELDLTAEQQEGLRTIAVEYRRAEIEKGAELEANRLDLMEMLREAEPNRAEVEAKVKQIGEIRTSLGLARVDALFKAVELLTADQREKLRDSGSPARLLVPRRRAREYRY